MDIVVATVLIVACSYKYQYGKNCKSDMVIFAGRGYNINVNDFISAADNGT